MVKKCWRILATKKDILLIDKAFQLTSRQKLQISQTICGIDFLKNVPNVQLFQKKYRLKTDKMSNTFGSLATKQIRLYRMRNVPNPIFIRLGEGFLLVIQILASMSEFGFYRYTRS